jgi:hypothetical protein
MGRVTLGSRAWPLLALLGRSAATGIPLLDDSSDRVRPPIERKLIDGLQL